MFNFIWVLVIKFNLQSSLVADKQGFFLPVAMLEKIGLPPKPSMRGATWVLDASNCQGCAAQFSLFTGKVINLVISGLVMMM